MIKVARATFNYKNSFTWTCKYFIIINHDSLRKKNHPTTLHVKIIGDPMITQEGSGAQI